MIPEIRSPLTLREAMRSEQQHLLKQDVRIFILVDLAIAISVKDYKFRRSPQGSWLRFRPALNTALTALK